MENCVIVAYGRSAIGKAGRGSLSTVNPIDFGAEVLRGVVERVPQLKLSDIDDVIVGCAIPEGKMGLNPGRNLTIRAGFPVEVPGQTVNRFCASGIQSIATGASMIMSGLQDVVVAGGVESMSCPVLSESSEFLNTWLLDHTDIYMPMGITAENVAEKFGITRERMEHMSVESHAKASEAVENGLFDDEIIPVKGFDKEGNAVVFKRDECYRKGTNKESLAKLKPCFKDDGLVTAATSSQRSDGASFVVLMSKKKAQSLGIKGIAKFTTFVVEGLEPSYMGLGPIYAIEKVIDKSGLSLNDIDVIELNEAFASQAIATIDELNLDKKKVNPRGGALALGHPLGATGAILLGKALNYLKTVDGRYGLVSMCIGGGMGAACIVEMIKE
ncbi:acetyl-CoA acyltransferase [Sedimentibacter acidaminivorans]|uniref:acetyl-CoA C-acyltransferase n=1 Tax=Sedimentibacter acidaminivorans TaxID=913099 RepID=A0ABS4GDP9_9FIRM|nr:thiolase family protein [Sedimentibacter acidaminivorans]MBP1925804.1 acetyl-CoA acyltransferase [Sedimentibacter acidaminivorans]